MECNDPVKDNHYLRRFDSTFLISLLLLL